MLVGLFGCEYRSGRAASAPLLRPNARGDDHLPDVPEADDSAGDLEALYLDEAGNTHRDALRHDERRLPHNHTKEEIAKFFPVLSVPPPDLNIDDWIPGGVDT